MSMLLFSKLFSLYSMGLIDETPLIKHVQEGICPLTGAKQLVDMVAALAISEETAAEILEPFKHHCLEDFETARNLYYHKIISFDDFAACVKELLEIEITQERTFMLNGVPKLVKLKSSSITYEELIALSEKPANSTVAWTASRNRNGILAPGESIMIHPEMRFEVQLI